MPLDKQLDDMPYDVFFLLFAELLYRGICTYFLVPQNKEPLFFVIAEIEDVGILLEVVGFFAMHETVTNEGYLRWITMEP